MTRLMAELDYGTVELVGLCGLNLFADATIPGAHRGLVWHIEKQNHTTRNQVGGKHVNYNLRTRTN